MKYILFLSLGMVFSSCGIYRQNVVNVPLVKQRAQLQAGIHESASGPEAQASYSLTDKVVVLANYNNSGLHTEQYSSTNYSQRQHYFGEVGMGLYRNRKVDSSNKAREIFVLAGIGQTYFYNASLGSNSYSSHYITQRVSYMRTGLQADIGWVFPKVSISISPRLLCMYYYDIQDSERSDYIGKPNTFIHAEGAFTFRCRLFRQIMFMSQMGASFSLTGYPHGYNYYYDFAPLNASVGIVANLGLQKHKK